MNMKSSEWRVALVIIERVVRVDFFTDVLGVRRSVSFIA